MRVSLQTGKLTDSGCFLQRRIPSAPGESARRDERLTEKAERGGMVMKEYDSFCTSMEKAQLKEELRKCEYCSQTLEEHDDCRKEVAAESGKRAQRCRID